MNKLAISVQTYNGNFDELTKTFNSIFFQTNKKFSMYLVDNGSNEKFKVIYEEFCKKNNITLLRVDKNEGIGSGRNKALQVKEKYLLRVDIGDSIEPKFVEKIYKHLDKNDYDFLIFRRIFNGKKEKNIAERIMLKLLFTNKVHEGGMLDAVLNIDFIQRINFSYPNNLIEDFNSNIFLMSHAKKIKSVNSWYIKPIYGMEEFHRTEEAEIVCKQSKEHYESITPHSIKAQKAIVNYIASRLFGISNDEIRKRFSGLPLFKCAYWNPFRIIAFLRLWIALRRTND